MIKNQFSCYQISNDMLDIFLYFLLPLQVQVLFCVVIYNGITKRSFFLISFRLYCWRLVQNLIYCLRVMVHLLFTMKVYSYDLWMYCTRSTYSPLVFSDFEIWVSEKIREILWIRIKKLAIMSCQTVSQWHVSSINAK